MTRNTKKTYRINTDEKHWSQEDFPRLHILLRETVRQRYAKIKNVKNLDFLGFFLIENHIENQKFQVFEIFIFLKNHDFFQNISDFPDFLSEFFMDFENF